MFNTQKIVMGIKAQRQRFGDGYGAMFATGAPNTNVYVRLTFGDIAGKEEFEQPGITFDKFLGGGRFKHIRANSPV